MNKTEYKQHIESIANDCVAEAIKELRWAGVNPTREDVIEYVNAYQLVELAVHLLLVNETNNTYKQVLDLSYNSEWLLQESNETAKIVARESMVLDTKDYIEELMQWEL